MNAVCSLCKREFSTLTDRDDSAPCLRRPLARCSRPLAATIDDFIPDLERLREQLQLRGLAAPDRSEIWACIGVAGRGVLRRSWTGQAEISASRLNAMASAPEPEPNLDATAPRAFPRLLTRSPRVGRCTGCWLKVGREMCSACGGRGRIVIGDNASDCSACQGGYRACDSCDGSGRAAQVEVEYVEHHVRPFAHVFLPESNVPVARAMHGFISTRSSIPDALRIHLDDDFASGDGYRGGTRGPQLGDVRLGHALDHARRYAARLTNLPNLLASKHEAHAWPYRVMTWNTGALQVAVYDEHRAPQLLL